ncbi:MAG: KpsF/GutQ family sugar-phosphate isomerase [Desulfobacterales bacterium]
MIIEKARDVLRIEAEGILNLIQKIGPAFSDMIDTVYRAKGRLIVTGIGKSGIVGRKIVATLNSTGTRSVFLHPVEAMHGDLGIVSREDVLLALSYSGETDELNILIPSIRSIGCKIISFTGNPVSTLARHSDIIIDVGVAREACPLGLAPTASTTAMLAMGDAMAIVLIDKNRFQSSDFKRIHPGGNLGQRLANEVGDLMMTGDHIPFVFEHQSMEDVIMEIDRVGLGAVFILSRKSVLRGIITDGDIRRLLAGKKNLFDLDIIHVMTSTAKSVKPDTPAYDALNLMEHYQITVLPVTDAGGKVHGILHLHDILGKGEFKFNGKQH